MFSFLRKILSPRPRNFEMPDGITRDESGRFVTTSELERRRKAFDELRILEEGLEDPKYQLESFRRHAEFVRLSERIRIIQMLREEANGQMEERQKVKSADEAAEIFLYVVGINSAIHMIEIME